MVRGLPEVRSFAPRLVEQTVSGAVSGSRHDCWPFAICFLVDRVTTQRRLLCVFYDRGSVTKNDRTLSGLPRSMRQACAGIFLGAVLIGPFEGSR